LRGQTALHDVMALNDGQAAVPVAGEVLHLQGGRKVRTTSGASCVLVAQAGLMLADCIKCKVRQGVWQASSVLMCVAWLSLVVCTCTYAPQVHAKMCCVSAGVCTCACVQAHAPPQTRTHTRVPRNPHIHSAWKHAHSPTHPQVRHVRRV
jgi:hypothetical protein